MRATRLSVANYNTTLSSDSLESGTGSSNSLRSGIQSSKLDRLRAKSHAFPFSGGARRKGRPEKNLAIALIVIHRRSASQPTV